MKKLFYKLTALAMLAAAITFSACKQDIEEPHEHTFATEWSTDNDYHWHAATCEHTDQVSDKDLHTWDEGKVTTQPTEKTEGVKTFACNVCKKTKTEVIAKLSHVHDYSDEWAFDATEHWHVCSGCDEKGSEANHTWDDGTITTAATEKTEGVKTYKCTVCNQTKTEKIEKIPHEHVYSDEYSSDKNYHWFACTVEGCNGKSGMEKHSFGDYVLSRDKRTSTAECTVCGYVDTVSNDINPLAANTVPKSQDFIFNTDSVGFTTITIRRSEWNKMLSYYDYFYKNENSVIAESYEYEKDGKSWKLNTVGLRLRGNTSRFRPQGKDSSTDECENTMPNASWSSSYYSYAATCSDDDYRQSHFKVDFEPLDDDDRPMSDCMKGVALKRCDSLFTREIFCYNLFHQYGIWTAPRASQTKVYINIVEDLDTDGTAKEDITDCEVKNIDFGVYEMFEEVNKQSLKGRMSKDNNNSAKNAWATNKGDLWKCSGGALTAESNKASNFGCEDIEILNTDKDKSEWTIVWERPCYDLKTNKSDVDTATAYFQNFITELNSLSDTTAGTDEGTAARKAFYEKWFDVDFFLKTYAVNILCGMDDDYWGNANNYYLYFDNSKNGTQKCYLIPFDYDNTLGCSINRDKVYINPLEWGYNLDSDTNIITKEDRPLMDRLLEVPEYRSKFAAILLEVSSQDSDSPWNKDNCISLWNQWISQVSAYVYSADMYGHGVGETSISDSGGWKEIKHYLTKDDRNIYEQVTENLKYWLEDEVDTKITFNLNGGNINGSTENVVVIYDGTTKKLENMIATPVKDNYDFAGWTKTLDDTDFVEKYNNESGLVIYAAWESQTSKTKTKTHFDGVWVETSPGTWTDVGCDDNVIFSVDAQSDGLHVTKSHNEEFTRISLKVHNDTTNTDLLFLDNIDQYNSDKNTVNQINTFVYPYVTADNSYTLTLELQKSNYTYNHSLSMKIKATGGDGDIYITHDGYTFDIATLTYTFKNLKINVPGTDDRWNYLAPLFTGETWGNIINFTDEDGTAMNGWCTRWIRDSEDPDKVTYYNWYESKEKSIWEFRYVPLATPYPNELYTALRYQYTDTTTNLTYLTEIVMNKIYPQE